MSCRNFFSQFAIGFRTAAMATLVVGCTANNGGAVPSAGGGGQPGAAVGGNSSESGIAGASTLGGASGTGGQTTMNMHDAGISDSSVELDAPSTASIPTPPLLLSATGLFTSVAMNGTLTLAEGVQEYQPLYPLWSDGAEKLRWIYLPPGSKIDTTTSMDHWSFPAGTKFWKEFDLNGQRLETRLLWKYGPAADDVSYWWDSEGGTPNDAEMADPVLGEQNVNGTAHSIPTEQDCETCHNSIEEHVLGFGAIELNHTLSGANIHSLIQAGSLTTNPALGDLAIPGDATAQAALGYLHANCGNCHNRSPGFSGVPPMPMYLRLLVGVQTVQKTDTYTTAVNRPTTDYMPGKVTYRIAGQDPTDSCITYTMAQRSNSRYEMPPLASNVADTAGIATVSAWIKTLPKPQ
jgi:hypothetical protein